MKIEVRNLIDSDIKALPLILTSDEGCNYGFYTHLGYEIIDSKECGYRYFDKTETLISFLFCLK